MLFVRIYYVLKPFFPKKLRLMLLRWRVHRILPLYSNIWPISQRACKAPTAWSGWPEQKKFALVLTHDVESSKGHDKCKQLIRLEERLGFRSSIFFVPELYQVSSNLRNYIISHGFEVGVHGLKHDGKLYRSRKTFQRRAVWINRYLKEWNSVGFRSPAMHCTPPWLHDLEIEYDASTFDTDPFEPQPNDMSTIFPFWVPGDGGKNGYVELPYTIPQDWTLFVLIQERSIDLWKKKLDWIAEQGGMALLITHPDYMNGDVKRLGIDEYPMEYYEEFLHYIKSKYDGQYWHVLPRDLARYWAKNIKSAESQVSKDPKE